MKTKLFKKLGLAFLGFAMAAGVGVGIAGYKGKNEVNASATAIYKISNTESVTTTGTAPKNSSATFSQTYSTKCQLTTNNSMVLTLSGYEGNKITGVKLSMKSNKSSGEGYLSLIAGSTTLASIGTASSGVAFNNAKWNGSYTTQYTPINLSLSNSTYSIKTSENVVLTIGATTSSLYCEEFQITYESASTDPVVSLTNTGKTKYMLNQDGSSPTISGISASAQNLGSSPVFFWTLEKESGTCSPSISGSGSTPTFSGISSACKFTISVSAAETSTSSKTTCSTTITLEIFEFGGKSLSQNNLGSESKGLQIKEGVGVLLHDVTLNLTYNDDSIATFKDGDESLFTISIQKKGIGDFATYEFSEVTVNDLSIGDKVKITHKATGEVCNSTEIKYLSILSKSSITEFVTLPSISKIGYGQVLYTRLTKTTSSVWGTDVTYSSSDETVAAIDANGKITAKSKTGSVIITATLESGNSAQISIEVAPANEAIYSPQQGSQMLSLNSISSNKKYYGTKSTTADSTNYYFTGYVVKVGSNFYIGDTSTSPSYKIQMYNISNDSSTTGWDGAEVGGKITAYGTFKYYNGPEIDTGAVVSYISAAVEDFTLSGPTEVYKNKNATFAVSNFSPATAATSVTWSVSPSTNATITNGVFCASASGQYTVRATSTTIPESGASVYKECTINVYEFYSVAFSFKANPKLTYYSGETLEDGLILGTVTYKSGTTLNYKVVNLTDDQIAPSYKYNNEDFDGTFDFGKNVENKTLEVTSIMYDYPVSNTEVETDEYTPTNLTLENVSMYLIVVDTTRSSIDVTNVEKTFGFGGEFNADGGTASIYYLYGYVYGESEPRILELSDNLITVEEPDMKKLGTQTVRVYYGEELVEIGHYDITITNTIETSFTDELEIKSTSKLKDNTDAFGTYSSVDRTFVTEQGNDITMAATGELGYLNDNYVQMKKNVKFYNSTPINGLTKITFNVGYKSSSITGNYYIYSGNAANTETSVSETKLSDLGKIEYNVPNGHTYFGIYNNTGRAIGFDSLLIEVNKVTYTSTEQVTAYSKYFRGNICNIETGSYIPETLEDAQTKWAILKQEYNAMKNDAKDEFVNKNTTNNDVLLAQRNYINMRAMFNELEDFAKGSEGNSTISLNAGYSLFNATSNSSIWIIAIVSLVGLTAIGGYFFYKKRKEN